VQVQKFLDFSQRILPEIQQSSSTKLPLVLPLHVAGFLAVVLGLDKPRVQLCWTAFSDMIPILNTTEQTSTDDLFRIHGHEFHIGTEQILPPMTNCPRTECGNAHLSDSRKVEARLYTLRRGVLPVYSVSMYCRHCFTRYYRDYSVQHAHKPNSRREYYGETPQFIHVAEHSFVERALCVHFEMQMAFSHASAESIARVYNLALGVNPMGEGSVCSAHLSHHLYSDLVLDAFFLHGLLRDADRYDERLVLPHSGLAATAPSL